MNAFGEGLKALVSLKILDINFFQCSEFSGSDIHSFAEGLPALTSLKALTLDFDNCAGFNDFGMKGLAQGVKALCSLETLIIRLNSCGGYTDKGIEFLGESFRNLCSLKNLELQARGCYFTDVGMQYLIEGWRNLPLEKIKLKVGYIFSIERIRSLGQCLNEIETLKWANLAIGMQESMSKIDRLAFYLAAKDSPWMKKAWIYFPTDRTE